MFIAPWVLVTTMLASGGGQSIDVAPSAVGVDQVFSVGNVSFAPAEQGSSSSSSSSSSSPTAPHAFGFGAVAGAGALGTGLLVRGWFGDRVGFDMRLLLSRAVDVSIGGEGGFSIEAAPSVIVMLTKADDSRQVDIRPYIGAGVNYTRAGTNAVDTGSPVSGSGEQVFGGVEAAIRVAGGFAISGEVLYNKRSQALVAAGVKSGATGEVGFIFYVK